jgi:tRNA G18 (ribose-2'-O)-methylase SpoU
MPDQLKGFFGVGVERISKPMNLGNLFRSAHAFGASFLFTINAQYSRKESRSDTSVAFESLPTWRYDAPEELDLPRGCALVGVELTDDAVALPSFRHPRQAAYVFGPERGSLSPELLDKAEFVVKIPTKFCINLASAGVVVMYDRMISLGRFAERPVTPHGGASELPKHVHGGKISHFGG